MVMETLRLSSQHQYLSGRGREQVGMRCGDSAHSRVVDLEDAVVGGPPIHLRLDITYLETSTPNKLQVFARSAERVQGLA